MNRARIDAISVLLCELWCGRKRFNVTAVVIQPLAIERCSNLAEPLCAQLAPVWELVASIPAPRGDHRLDEDPALAQQVSIDARIVLADVFGRMGEVEFDRPTATRFEVYDKQSVPRGEHVAQHAHAPVDVPDVNRRRGCIADVVVLDVEIDLAMRRLSRVPYQ